ncbi:MAG: winged helix-turn-helix domain-containing protein [Gemmatimonadales bacterium]
MSSSQRRAARSAQRARPRPYIIERRDQIAALESPVRQEVVDTIQATGPCSALEIAELMGRPADALYYHIRRLTAVGLLVPLEVRRRGRRDETVYDLAGHPLVLKYPTHRDALTHPLNRLVRSMLRTAERDFRTAVASEDTERVGPLRNLWASRRYAWLSAADLRRVNRTMDELIDLLTQARHPRRGKLCTLTVVLAPRAEQAARRPRPDRAAPSETDA